MYSEFDEQQSEEPTRSRLKSCLMTGLTVLVILGLLGSAIGSVVWMLSRQAAERTVAEIEDEVAVTESSIDESPATVAATAVPQLVNNDESEGTATAVSPIPTRTSDRINRIVFVNENGQIESVAPDGTARRVLTAENQIFRFPAWSPDGQHLAAVGVSEGGKGLVTLLADEADATPQTLYSSRTQSPFYLYWAPNSRHVSFLANHPRDAIGLHLAAIEGESESRLLATGNPFYWNWTADASQMLVHVGGVGDDARVALVDVDEGGDGEEIAQPGLFQAPGISASGRYWAYAEIVGRAVSRLIVKDTQTDKEHRQRHRGLIAMSWSPTADQLAFINSEDSLSLFFGPLRLLDAQSGKIRTLSEERVFAFFWSPDGRYLAYLTANTSNEDSINVLAPSSPKQRGSLGKPAQQSPLLLFNLAVIDVETGEGLELATFQPTELFLGQFLPFFDQYALSHRIWSPDSNALVFAMQIETINRIFVIPVSGGRAREIGQGTMPFWSHQ